MDKSREFKSAAVSYFLSLWDEKAGGFRFASNQPATLMATAYCVLGLELVGGLSRLGEVQRAAIISFLMAGVQPDGSFRDPLFRREDILGNQHDLTYFQEETTTFCQQALDALLTPPPPPRDWSAKWRAADGLIQHFKSFPWKNPWLDSNRVMFVLSQLCHDAERHQKPELLELVDVALSWLDAHQSPITGLWQGPHAVDLTNAMAATFHFTFFYFYRGRPVRYLEKIIDSCLSLQEPHGLFSGNAIGHTCLDYDALDLLAKASIITRHRGEQVQKAMKRAHDALTRLHNNNTDGGFANCKEDLPGEGLTRRLFQKLSLGRFFPPGAPIPAKRTYSVCWRLLSCESAESNAFSTWFRLLALQLATQTQGSHAESEEKVTFRRLPFLGYHDPIAIQRTRRLVTRLVKDNG